MTLENSYYAIMIVLCSIASTNTHTDTHTYAHSHAHISNYTAVQVLQLFQLVNSKNWIKKRDTQKEQLRRKLGADMIKLPCIQRDEILISFKKKKKKKQCILGPVKGDCSTTAERICRYVWEVCWKKSSWSYCIHTEELERGRTGLKATHL